MDSRSTAAESKHTYSPAPWVHSPAAAASTAPTTTSAGTPAEPSPAQLTAQFDLLPLLFPQQSLYQAQLLQYNKLISPGRGGGVQPQQFPPAVSTPHIQAAPRSRSASKASNKDHPVSKGAGGHGNKPTQNPEKSHRGAITSKEAPSKMATKHAELQHPLPARPPPLPVHGQSHSSSVPSTPHQHARNFSFGSREPSPNATSNHSPRSAYSETNTTLPSIPKHLPRLGGCKYETAQVNSRRRIPYSVGTEDLEKLDSDKIKSKLSEDEERKLTTDMRELFDRLLPTDEVEKKRQMLVTKLDKIFNDEWPGHDIRVHLFGSSGNFLCSDDSDVDICITTPWEELRDVCKIAELLARHGMEKVVCISAAKVPIVKIWDPEIGLACDMNVNNTLALENTRMVKTYVEIDNRVRPLAMIIKYWTRRRIVNDAEANHLKAFGGTLSSYTWTCLVIAFLQLRNPPVLPTLHQRHHQGKKSGKDSVFADDVEKLRGMGDKNKSSLGDLLFEFFRFYAHEFDYDKYALSVRLGRLLTKKEKNWHRAINNRLCIEEPFNTSRNLGNTVDEYSFRGLHLELRRAFDLISEGKLDECCEQFIFPKEEERIFMRPPPQPRPILMRSASQTHSGRGRGGFGRGRHSNNYHRSGNSSRRASSSVAYEAAPNAIFMQPIMTPQDLAWYPSPPMPMQYHQDLVSAALLAQAHQESSLRLQQLYSQSHMIAQAQALQQQQRMQAGVAQSASGSDRSRTNSFDNPPLSAPLRPDLYGVYTVPLQAGHPFYSQAGLGNYPSSPATTSGATTEFRRSLQRSANPDSGTSNSGSSLRSQSQPASRSVPPGQPGSVYQSSGLSQPNGLPLFPPRNANGIPIPSFIPDENDFEDASCAKLATESPPSEEDGYMGYCVGESSPVKRPQRIPNGIAFGDLHQPPHGRRRLSTELPQAVLDHRLRRASRSPSPSPHGHARALSAGTSSAPLVSGPFPSQDRSSPQPVIVNGSALRPSPVVSQRQPSGTDSLVSEDSGASGYDNPLHIHQGFGGPYGLDPSATFPSLASSPRSLPDRQPVIVNGTTTAAAANAQATPDDASFRERVALMNQDFAAYQNFFPADYGLNARLSPSTRHRLMSRQQQNGVIAPLDLAIGEYRASPLPLNTELQHLSPVYEGRTPSPTAVRKFETLPHNDKPGFGVTEGAPERSKSGQKQGREPEYFAQEHTPTPSGNQGHSRAQTQPASTVPPPLKTVQHASQQFHKPQLPDRPPGDSREAPVKDGDRSVRNDVWNSDNGWQKAPRKGRKGADAKGHLNGHAHGEQPPKNESERKGG